MCYYSTNYNLRCDGVYCSSDFNCDSNCCDGYVCSYYACYGSGANLVWLWWTLCWFFIICCIISCVIRARRRRMMMMARQAQHRNHNSTENINVIVT